MIIPFEATEEAKLHAEPVADPDAGKPSGLVLLPILGSDAGMSYNVTDKNGKTVTHKSADGYTVPTQSNPRMEKRTIRLQDGRSVEVPATQKPYEANVAILRGCFSSKPSHCSGCKVGKSKVLNGALLK